MKRLRSLIAVMAGLLVTAAVAHAERIEATLPLEEVPVVLGNPPGPASSWA